MSVDVDLLGVVTLRRAGVAQALRRGKERALLARLALAAPQPIPIGTLVTDLWPEATPARPIDTLRVHVANLRRALGSPQQPGRELLQTVDRGYRLALSPAAIDVHRFEHAIAAAERRTTPMERAQIDLSDIITFHNYDHPTELEKRINWLKRYNRPMICTEYMARGNGSFFSGGLTVGKAHNVGMINWGLVQGKTQTHLPWDSWQRPYTDREPTIWFHEVFRNDGTPYMQEEVDFIRRMTGKAKAKSARAVIPSLFTLPTEMLKQNASL